MLEPQLVEGLGFCGDCLPKLRRLSLVPPEGAS